MNVTSKTALSRVGRDIATTNFYQHVSTVMIGRGEGVHLSVRVDMMRYVWLVRLDDWIVVNRYIN